MPYAGATLRETFTLINPDDSPILGEVLGGNLVMPISRDPDGVPFHQDVTIDEIGQGAYAVVYPTATTAPPGHYYLMVRYTGALPRTFEIEWDLDPVQYAAPTTVGVVVSGPTLRDARRSVMRLLGGFIVTTATEASGSSEWVDLDRLVQGGGNYAGRDLYVSGGTLANVGEIRRIAGNSAGGRLQLQRGLPADVQAGDEAELFNPRGIGLRHEDVMAQVLHSIEIASPTTTLSYDLPDTFDYSTRALTIPDAFHAVGAVHARWPDWLTDGYAAVPRASHLGGNGWWIDVPTRTLYLGGYIGTELHGANLRLTGLARITPPETDDDIVAVNAEWLTYQTAADLALRPLSGGIDADNLQRLGMVWQQKASEHRPRTRNRPRQGWVVLA